MTLQNQSILIIGGSSGIGLATAQLTLTKGAHVVVASRSPEKAQATLGNQIEIVSLDMSQEQQVQGFFKRYDGIFHHILVTTDKEPFDHVQVSVSGSVTTTIR